MNGPSLSRLLRTCNAILLAASWIVPRGLRPEWLQERKNKVWHWCHFLAESGRLTSSSAQEVQRYCRHSCVDAFWVRFDRATAVHLYNEVPRTPAFLLSCCFGILFLLLTGQPYSAMKARFSTSSPDLSRILQVSLDDHAAWMEPELLRDEAQQWASEDASIQRVGVYAIRPSLIRGDRGSETVNAARVTPDTLRLLNARPTLGRLLQESDASDCSDCVVLSYAIWKNQFRGDMNVVGRTLTLNKKPVRIIGVTAANLPGRDIGVYTLLAADQPLLPTFEWPGALVQLWPNARLDGSSARLQRIVDHSLQLSPGTRATALSLAQIRNRALRTWFGMMAFALAIVCALNWRLIARLITTGPRSDTRAALKWYAFLLTKTVLLLLIALIASSEIVQVVFRHLSNVSSHWFAGTASIWLFLLGASLALTWSIRDQLARCRTCMRRFGMEVYLWGAGRTFLEITGAELVCDQGHGTLHVPEMETGCVDSERWAYMDDSWRILGPRSLEL